MAKPKHPTLKSLKQGQTIYCVTNDSFLKDEPLPDRIERYFLYSQNEPLPPEGQIITKLPVTNVKKAIKQCGQSIVRDFYYSKSKAKSAAKL